MDNRQPSRSKHELVDGIRAPRRPAVNRNDYLGIRPAPPKPPVPTKTISLQLKVPHIKLPQLPYKKYGYILGAFLAVIVAALVSVTIFKPQTHPSVSNGVKSTVVAAAQPDFKILAPKDKPDLATTKDPNASTYDAERQVFTYKDFINKGNLIVSQQVLPDNFKKDSSLLSQVLKAQGPQVKFDSAWGPVYVATDSKTGQQSLVFAYFDKLLVFLQSPMFHDNDIWKIYIENLRQ